MHILYRFNNLINNVSLMDFFQNISSNHNMPSQFPYNQKLSTISLSFLAGITFNNLTIVWML